MKNIPHNRVYLQNLFSIMHLYILYLEPGCDTKFIRKQIHPNMQKTPEQRIFIVEQFISTGSRTLVKRAFEVTLRESIDLKTVDRVVKKWKSEGSILNQNKGNSGRKRSARTEENVATVNGRIQESSQSVRKMEAELGINREYICLLYTSPSPRDKRQSRMPSSA